MIKHAHIPLIAVLYVRMHLSKVGLITGLISYEYLHNKNSIIVLLGKQ